MRYLRLSSILVVVGSFGAWAKVINGPLEHVNPGVGTLFKTSNSAVSVVVKDERPDKMFVAAGLIGPKADRDKGIYLAYLSLKDDELSTLADQAVRDAVSVLGLKVGTGPTLEVTIKDFWVDLYRLGGFSPMNCMGYGTVEAVLRSSEGADMGRQSVKVAFLENSTPVGSMHEVAREALSRIYAQAAWQATTAVLREQLKLEADPAAVKSAIATALTAKEDLPARETVFWVGLSGVKDAEVKDKLLELMRSSQHQRVRQAAAEALGMLGFQDVKDEVVGLLNGSKKTKEWDNEDTEQVWYLLRTLSYLGTTSLRDQIPKTELTMPNKLQDLIGFLEAGKFREFTPAEKEGLADAKKDGASDRKP